MEVRDERKKGKRRSLFEVPFGKVVRLDSRDGFWLRRDGESGNNCSLVSIVDGTTHYPSRDLEVTLVAATVTITDA